LFQENEKKNLQGLPQIWDVESVAEAREMNY
jgi:hypothetical protein